MTELSQVELVDRLVAAFANQKPIRAGSFIITIYGDAVAPRGGAASMQGLLAVMETVGVSDSLVRTAVSRLVSDGWLARARVGRRSFYRLTDSGRRRFEEATRRIYAGPPTDWDGNWRLVLVPGGASERRERLRKDLRWIGFGQLAPGALIHPSPDAQALEDVLAVEGEDGDGGDGAMVIDGRTLSGADADTLQALVADCWSLEDLAAGYRAFIERFAPLGRALAGGGVGLSDLQCLLVRLLLIHEYRKVILRDPMLPVQLLPQDWIGGAAHDLCRDIYAAVVGRAERWLSENFETETGPLPTPHPRFFTRFGGIAA